MEKLGGDHKTRRTVAIASAKVGWLLLYQAGWGRPGGRSVCAPSRWWSRHATAAAGLPRAPVWPGGRFPRSTPPARDATRRVPARSGQRAAIVLPRPARASEQPGGSRVRPCHTGAAPVRPRSVRARASATTAARSGELPVRSRPMRPVRARPGLAPMPSINRSISASIARARAS